MSFHPRFSLLAITLAAAALAVSAVGLPSAVANGTHRAHHALVSTTAGRHARQARESSLARDGRVLWARNQSLCATRAKAGQASCDLLRRVPAAADSPGAYAYSRPAYAHGPAGGLTPADLAKAYDFNPSLGRRYQTIALVNWYDDPHALADLDHFDRHYGLAKETARSFRKVNQTGARSPLPRPNRDSAGEISLDIETARAVCHSCRILLVEARGPSAADLAAAENTAARLGATEISNSYGLFEEKLTPAVLAAYNHPGIVITASTGDDGWYNWDLLNESNSAVSPGRAAFPATDPHVVAVGGTTLTLHSNGTRADETVWDSNGTADSTGMTYAAPLGASGGGCSRYFDAPAWQRHHAGYSAAGCHGRRLAADVSADADPATGFDIYDSYHAAGKKSWITVGGTSLSSPLVAALYALAGGSHGSAYPAASLYINATHRSYTRYDVTSGGNGFCGGDNTTSCSQLTFAETESYTNNPNTFGAGLTDCSFPTTGRSVAAPKLSSQCNAVKGYDGPSGIGTPRRASLFAPTNPSVSVTHPHHARANRSVHLVARVRERVSAFHPVRFAWRFGDGRSTTVTRPGVHHHWTHRGSYTVRLQVTDSSGQSTVVSFRQKVR